MSNAKILRRIEKCLALSESSNKTEAETALRQAKKLMEANGIDDDTLVASKVKAVSPEYNFKSEKMRRDKTWLCSVIMKAFDVRCYLTIESRNVVLKSGETRRKNVQIPVFYGVGKDADIAAYIFDVTSRRLDEERKKYIKTLNGMSAPEKTKLANSFSEGWVIEVQKKVETFSVEIDSSKEKAMDLWAKNNLGNIRYTKSRKRRVTRSQVNAMDEGRRNGSNVNLFVGTGHDKDNSTMIGNGV